MSKKVELSLAAALSSARLKKKTSLTRLKKACHFQMRLFLLKNRPKVSLIHQQTIFLNAAVQMNSENFEMSPPSVGNESTPLTL